MHRTAFLLAAALCTGPVDAVIASDAMPGGLPAPIDGEARVYAIAPSYLFGEDRPLSHLDRESLEQLHSDYVVASAAVEDLAEVVNALNDAFDPDALGPLCFDPRHGLRYRSESGEVIALVCFKCHKTLVVIEGWTRYFNHGRDAVDLLQFARAAMEEAGAKYPDMRR